MTLPDCRQWSKPFWQATQRGDERLILIAVRLQWHHCDDFCRTRGANVTIRYRRRGMMRYTASSLRSISEQILRKRKRTDTEWKIKDNNRFNASGNQRRLSTSRFCSMLYTRPFGSISYTNTMHYKYNN